MSKWLFSYQGYRYTLSLLAYLGWWYTGYFSNFQEKCLWNTYCVPDTDIKNWSYNDEIINSSTSPWSAYKSWWSSFAVESIPVDVAQIVHCILLLVWEEGLVIFIWEKRQSLCTCEKIPDRNSSEEERLIWLLVPRWGAGDHSIMAEGWDRAI